MIGGRVEKGRIFHKDYDGFDGYFSALEERFIV